jgi:hypothetical protein
MFSQLRSFATMALVMLGACTPQLVCREPGQEPRCVQSGGPEEAAITGAAAAGAWAFGGGCNIAGCHPPMVCNRQSGFCEHAVCGEALPRCPAGTACDARTRTCR